MAIPADMTSGAIHQTTSFGKLKVTKYVDALHVSVEFVNTGYKTTVRSDHIRGGRVKDKLFRNVYGVGFLGDGEFKAGDGKGKHTRAYKSWNEILKRCYGDKYKEGKPCYDGCTTCPDWHNFQNFAKWYYENYPADGGDYHLDKDIKIEGNKEYSPNACMFVSPADNAVKARAKIYKLINPKGEEVEVHNLAGFARDNGLSGPCMQRVVAGLNKSHKGWTINKKDTGVC